MGPRAYLYASREEILPLAGLEPQIVQPIASCYMDHDGVFEDICYITTYETTWYHKLEHHFLNNTLMNCEQLLGVLYKILPSAHINRNCFFNLCWLIYNNIEWFTYCSLFSLIFYLLCTLLTFDIMYIHMQAARMP